ncbi:MarR family winged helix-turn-helix transcriptional regulator [Pseudorhodoplanes sp.]|uniref:MarR family winged helix-turn-helix transcriptional regulator n=1 Tax=Pseudorhodoplanes sp. TaxID=1934341 RepID=UPI002C2DC993|nr:MarR family winged helix-turn-helix transcriptional regulator [Pseudorhodoplanes sp.]HWV54564.1 MarR family winged helix-turn-helix transcriptional regulator [Pseudorhodoplanes sp.]
MQPTPSALARRFHQICTSAVAGALADSGLTPLQYAVLAYLYVNPDIEQNSLAARLGVDRASTSMLVDQLEKQGLVERRINGEDRRARLLRLSRPGIALRKRLHPTGRAVEKEILSALTAAEQETLIALLTRVVATNEALARPGAGRRKPKPRNSSK